MRLLVFGLLGFISVVAPCHRAWAQKWPDRPVTMIVPFPAGSAVDTLARAIANQLGENLGKQFIVDNRTGAGGGIGANAVAKAAPDGYTLLFGTPAPIALNKLMYKSLAYDTERDLMPVILVAKAPLIVAAKVDFPAQTFEELIAYAKANPDKVNVGHPGNGTLGHITSELIQQFTGVKMTNVPYRGTAPLTTDLLGGVIDVAMDFMPTYVQLAETGKIKVLAVTTGNRAEQMPTVPTAQQAGFKGFEASAWFAMVAPSGTPKEIVSTLNELINAYLKSEKGKALLAQNALQPMGGTPHDLKLFVAGELAKWKPVIEAAKITM